MPPLRTNAISKLFSIFHLFKGFCLYYFARMYDIKTMDVVTGLPYCSLGILSQNLQKSCLGTK